MAVFTDEQIKEIISIFTQHMGHRQYIGARYVPIFGRVGEDTIEWDDTKPYEPLTIVLHQGNSFTSRQYVPAGIDINNVDFWANTGNYNAQIEQYRQEVLAFDGRITQNSEDITTLKSGLADEATNRVNADNDLSARIDNEVAAREEADKSLSIQIDATQTKVNASKSQLVNTLDESKATTDDTVVVTTLTNYYMDNTRAELITTEALGSGTNYEASTMGIQRDDEKYLIPNYSGLTYTQSGNPKGAICCGGTFLNKGITYGRTNGIFNTDTVTAQQMVCSDFVWLMLMGAEYQASKFAAPYTAISQYCAEMPKAWTSQNAPVEKRAWITRELAAAYAAAGKLFKVNSRVSNVMPGDIIFNSAPSTETNYLGIAHCALVVDVQYELQLIDVLQCGSNSAPLRYDFTNQTESLADPMTPMFAEIDPKASSSIDWYVARPNWNFTEPRKIWSGKGTQDMVFTATSATSITITPDVEIPQGAYVEVKLHGNFSTVAPSDTSNNYFRLLLGQSPDTVEDKKYRIGRYYTTKARSGDIPASLVLKGFTNGALPTTGAHNIIISCSSTTPGTVQNVEWECNIYVP